MDSDDTGEHSFHFEEDSFEPRHLIRRSDVILRAGMMMLGAGTGSRRVKETMRQVATALDIDTLQAQITFTDITLTVSRRGIFRTQVAEIEHPGGVNADRVAALQYMAGRLRPRMRVREVEAQLDAVERRGLLYPKWVLAVAAAIACAAFALLNQAGLVEAGAALVAALLGQSARLVLSTHRINVLAVVAVAALVAGLTYVGINTILGQFGLAGSTQSLGYVATFIFLVPGFPLITAALDLARLDLEAGGTRLLYAGLVMLTAGMVAWGLLAATGGDPSLWLPAPAPEPAIMALIQLAATLIGVAGFALVFNSPWRVALAAGLIAAPANMFRHFLVETGAPPHVAVAAATLVIGLLVWVLGEGFGLPRIILSVPAVLMMVPGVTAYRSLVAFNQGQLIDAMLHGIAAVLVVIGAAAGLAAARMLTDPQWAFTRPDPPQLLKWPRPRRRRRDSGRPVRSDEPEQ